MQIVLIVLILLHIEASASGLFSKKQYVVRSEHKFHDKVI